MPINDAYILALKPKRRPYKVSIGKGAFLLVRPDGKKYWRLKYHLDGKESTYSLGVFPRISVAAAMTARDSVKALVRKGIKPAPSSREEKRKALFPEPLFRLGFSIKGSLSIETETHVVTFTPRQTQALAVVLSAKLQKEKELSSCHSKT
jgi:hypothetical protein